MNRTQWLLIATLIQCMACNPKLPEPQSEGARLYFGRCSTCHRLYAPQSMTYDMWKMQVERMQAEIARRGLPPLTPTEQTVMLEYLKRHSG
jgi:hypothetical protein